MQVDVQQADFLIGSLTGCWSGNSVPHMAQVGTNMGSNERQMPDGDQFDNREYITKIFLVLFLLVLASGLGQLMGPVVFIACLPI